MVTISSTTTDSWDSTPQLIACLTRRMADAVWQPLRIACRRSMSLSFMHFKHQLGDAGARERFEEFVAAAVKAIHPSARPIRANPGDWGIDTYFGSLYEGDVAVWQSKFFLDVFGDSQKQQIRSSYDEARKNAAKRGYRILAWTLCIPQDLDGPGQQWWDKFVRDRKDDGITIELWNLSEFRTLLGKPDAADVRAEYFPHLDPVHPSTPPELAEVPADAGLDDLLFVRQLHEAGMTEVSSAKEQFYNAELVQRDLEDKGLERRVKAFDGMRRGLRSIWEDRFNHHCGNSDATNRLLAGLHGDVMSRVDAEHDLGPDRPFPLTRVHRKGALHQVVEVGGAGWTRDWRETAQDHGRS